MRKLNYPELGFDETCEIEQALEGYVTARDFESALSDYTGIDHFLTTNSGTAALHLALKVLGIGNGDIVWVPTMNFIGGVSPVMYVGAQPVFIDCDEYLTIDISLCERASLPKAILATDIYGQCCDWKTLREFCDKHGIYLIGDCAESLGSLYGKRDTGSMADICIYSFNNNKIVTTTSGGAIASSNETWIDKARFYSNQAREDCSWYEHVEIGYNYRMSDILAAIGIAQLGTLEDRIAKRRDMRNYYQLDIMEDRPNTRTNAWLAVAMLDDPVKLRIALKDIETRPVFKPMHLQPVFKNEPHILNGTAENAFKKGLCLPTVLTQEEQRVINKTYNEITK